MKLRQYQTLIWGGMISLLAILLMPFITRPLGAAAQPGPLDVATIDAFVREQVQRHNIPGLALGIVDGNEVVFLQGYGKADQTGRAVTPQTPFILASASKPVTALAMMQLVEAGKVELDAPVQRYLPEFQVADPIASQQITVRHLLQHTSGIPEQGCQNSRFGATTPEQFVAALRTIALDAAPGTRHIYCSGNYNVLGRIIEVVSGQSYASYIEQHIFAPLQMHHSFAAELTAQQHGLAQGYWWLFGLPVPMSYPYDVPQIPSGFLAASAEDMSHFLVAQLNGGRFASTSVLSPQGIAAMQAPGIAIGSGEATYGLGWKTGAIGGVPTISHSGDHPNAHTLVLMVPGMGRGAVLLINANNLLALATAFTQIEEGLAQLLTGQEPALASLHLPTLYLIVDAVLIGLLTLALWPFLRLRRWEQQLAQHPPQHGRRLRMGLRVGWECVTPVMLLLGVYLLNRAVFGTQSWGEILLLFPDIGAWLWICSGLMLLTGAIRLILLLGVLRRNTSEYITSEYIGAHTEVSTPQRRM